MAAFDPWLTSTARRTLRLDLWGHEVEAYANANLSIVSGTCCPGRCGFCVEKLRPASRGARNPIGRADAADDGLYFETLERCLDRLRPLDPSVSLTGGEVTLDPRLPRILRLLQIRRARKRTLTSNGVGLLEIRERRRALDWIIETGVRHLNLSRAHPEDDVNFAVMGVPGQLAAGRLADVAAICGSSQTRLRLSCVLLAGAIADLPGVRRYLAWAEGLGVDNVVFRQLMRADPATASDHPVVAFSAAHRVPLEPLLSQLDAAPDFSFLKQIVGYYYYVEVWRWHGIDVVFEEADLASLEASRRRWPGLVLELVLHPDATLASTWQPWDGVLLPAGPPARPEEPREPAAAR